MQTSHTRLWLTGTLILLCVAMLGVAIWLALGRPLGAQTITDPCADAETVESSDFTVNWYNPEGELAARHVGHSSTAGMRIKNYDPNAVATSTGGARSTANESEPGLMSETIRLYRWGGGTDQAARSTQQSASIEYSRAYQGGGQWTEWEVQERMATDTSGATPVTRYFCGRNLDRFSEFTYDGEVMLDGVSTKKYTGLYPFADGSYRTWEFWVDGNGRNVKNTSTTDNGYVLETYNYGWNEPNTMIAAPAEPDTPTPSPTSTAVPVPTNTPEPTPAPATAWLEPDPETVTFDGSGWQTFTIHGTGVDRIDFSINAINHPDGPSSTGAVARTRRSTPPAASDACRNTGYEGYSENPGGTFSLVGCRAGTSIIQLGEFVYGSYVLLRRYTVDVTGGP